MVNTMYASLAAVDKAMYSAYVVLRATTLCFLDSQLKAAPAAKKAQPVNDLRSVESPAQSAST